MSSTIRRAKKDADNPYKAMRRATFEDSRLSWEARGVLAYILVKPDNWKINVANLVNQAPGGRDRVYRIINELIDCGYVQRTEVRISGKIAGYDYIVFEEPHTEEMDTPCDFTEEPYTENQYTETPLTEKPYTAQPYTANTHHNKEEEVVSKKGTKQPAAQAQPVSEKQPKAKKPKATPETLERRRLLREKWVEVSDSENYNPAQVNTGIALLDKADCTPEELAECHRWIQEEPFFKLKTIYPQTIFKRLDEFRRYQGRKATNHTKPPAPEPITLPPAAQRLRDMAERAAKGLQPQ